MPRCAAGRTVVVRAPSCGASWRFTSRTSRFSALVAYYALVAPGRARQDSGHVVGLAISQAYIVARVWVKLVFWGRRRRIFRAQGSGIRV